MPQPYRKKEKVQTPPRVVMQRPECAVRIAAVAAEWAQMEFWLGGIFTVAMGRTGEPEGDNDVVIVDRTTQQIMDAVESIRVQIAVIRAALRNDKIPDQVRTDFETLASAIRDGGKARNRVVHGRWGLSDAYPDAIILQDGGKAYVYTPKDLDEIIDRVTHLQTRAIAVLAKCIMTYIDPNDPSLSAPLPPMK